MLIEINSYNPHKRRIDNVVRILERGGIIAYPTDTIYGIGCNIMNKKAIEKIYRIKQHKKNPMSFICSGLKHISHYAKVSNYAYKIMKHCLPGPYTFVLEASKLVPKIMLTKQKTAGIRFPDNKICMELVKKLGNPIISTSAITRDNTILSDPTMIHEYFGKSLDVIIDGGPAPGEPSSVISLVKDNPKIIRIGMGDVGMFDL